MREVNINILPAQASATLNSAAIPALNLFAVSAQIVTGGTATGTMKLQASNDDPVNGSAPANWSDIPSATIAVSGAGVYLIPKTECCYQWIRVAYTNSGTGTMSVVVKALGA